MPEIEWVVLSPITSYYIYQQYLLKRRRRKGYFVYSVWGSDRLLYNTISEYEFMDMAKRIFNNEAIAWKAA